MSVTTSWTTHASASELGLVIVAAYSRITCRLIHTGRFAASTVCSASIAMVCWATRIRVAQTMTFVSTMIGSATVIAVHILAPQRDFRIEADVMAGQVGYPEFL